MDRVMSLVIRAEYAPRAGRCDPASLAPAVRRAVWSVDRDQPIVRVATMDQLVAALAAERRFALVLFEASGLAALAVRQGLGLAVLGAAVGLVAATVASRAIAALLFAVSPLDPVTYLGVIALLAGVSAVACWVPAWRAARVEPSTALEGA